MAVVKGDGYGHGAVAVARAALSGGASWLGVATVEEARCLRASGIGVPLMVLGFLPPDDARSAEAMGVRAVVGHASWIEPLAAAAPGLAVHLKVDTGMGRIGVFCDDAVRVARRIVAAGLHLEGVMTHLAMADTDEAATWEQLRRMEAVLSALSAAGIRPRWIHAQNSAGLLDFTVPFANLARAGIALYGLHPDGVSGSPPGLQPAMALRAKIIHVKKVGKGFAVGYGATFRASGPMTIATLPVGYADGFSRLLSNRGEVLFRGRRYPIVGRVSMDQLTIGLPADSPAEIGDEVTLMGRDGGAEISAGEVAGKIGTINYEVATGLSLRLERRYRW